MIYTAIDKKSKKIHCIILLKNIDRRSGKVYTFYGEKAMEIKYYKHKLEKAARRGRSGDDTLFRV